MASHAVGIQLQEHQQTLGSSRCAGQTGISTVPSLQRFLHGGSASIAISGQSRSDQFANRDTVITYKSNYRSSNTCNTFDSRRNTHHSSIGADISGASSGYHSLSPHRQGSQRERDTEICPHRKTTPDHQTSTSRYGDRHHHIQRRNDTKLNVSDGESFDETDGGPHLQQDSGYRSWDGTNKAVKVRPSLLHKKGASHSEHSHNESRVDSGFNEDMDEGSISSSDEDDPQKEISLGQNTCENRLGASCTNSSLEGAHLSKRQLKRQRKRARQRESGAVTQTEISVLDALREENDRLKQQMYCRVCMDAPVGAMLLPCKHTVLCWSCSQRLIHCPLCRAPIANRITIYLSGY